MKKQVLFLVLYVIAVVVVLIYDSLQTNISVWHRLINDLVAVYFAICCYETCKGLINKEK
jgi:hypothetical protein